MRYNVSQPTLRDLGDGKFTISRMQPIGDAASELANLLDCTHPMALAMLQMADEVGDVHEGPACTITSRRDDIVYAIVFR